MNSIYIKTREKRIATSKSLYGLFFEDINRAGDGGIYAELLRNRAFDDGVLPEGCVYDAKKKQITSPTGWTCSFDCYEAEGIAAWEAVGGAKMQLTDTETLHENRKRALQVNFCGGSIRNDGFQGVFVEKDKSYRFYMFAKAQETTAVTVQLASAGGEVYAQAEFMISGGYAKYECILTSDATDADARLVLSSASDAEVTLGFTSLFPVDTYMGRENGLRKSLVEKLLALKPAFLRFPGGCIVEGFTRETAFRFEDTIGPVWERKPHWLLWSYMTTNGLGYHEYLQFCEDAQMDAMYVFNCGMTCQGRQPDFFEPELVEQYYEDAVHAILYATAPADSEWGAKRAQNGHPEPFTVLKYLEIGNENWGPEYHTRYEYFYERLKKEFPQFIYISTDHTERAGKTTEVVDEHFYSDPIFFASNHKMYDALAKDGVDIYCGEYAATIGCKEGILYGALGEAAFLTGIERNQDKVFMTSYAPLFQNVAYKEWEPDMILFNNHEDFAIPSYYMLQMFASNRGDYVCEYEVETEHTKRREIGGFGIMPDDTMMYSGICVNDKLCDEICVVEGDITLASGEVYAVSGACWGTVGELSENTQCFKAQVQSESGRIHIRFWDVAMRGEDQNHYDWFVEAGKSRVEHYNCWSCERICNPVDCNVLSGKNNVEIHTKDDGFTILLNGEVLHQQTLAVVPHITAVCTVDEQTQECIIKIVNISEEETDVHVALDVEAAKEAEMTILTGDSYDAKNSFENKECVVPYTTKIATSSDYVVTMKPRSVNIIRQKICG